MCAPTETGGPQTADAAIPTIDLRSGLPAKEVHTRLQQGLRLQDAGQRALAFYLVEVDERRLYQSFGVNSTAEYAEHRLDLDPRRTRELLATGRKLLELPCIDTAFCEQEIGWSKVRELVRVAVPEHEAAWVERAKDLTWRKLREEVAKSRPGSPPPGPDGGKGTPSPRFPVKTLLDSVAFKSWEQARQALSDEVGYALSDAEAMRAMAEMVLSTEADGSIPGRKAVDMSLYRIALGTRAGPSGRRAPCRRP